MRVALVGDYPLDANRISGGPQAVFAYLVQGLERFQNLELHVVAAHKTLDSPRTVQREGVTFHYLPYPKRTTFLAYPTLWRSIQRTLRQIEPDLVHGQSGYIYGTIVLGSGYPAALTVHSIHGTEVRFAASPTRRLNVGLQHLLMRWYFTSRVRHVVSISPYIRQHYESQIKATFYDIDNPVSDDFFELDPDQETPSRVLFIGFLRAVKRPDMALRAFALAREQVPELSLHFAGAAIDPLLKAQLQEFVDSNQLGQRVKFLGHLSEAQVLEAYQQMSILLLTSELETSAMAILQAMAAGKPVVATAVGGVPFLVDDERTGILAGANSVEELARGLVTLARDPDLRRRMRQAARSEALDRFKSDVVAAKTFAMYQEILKDGQG